MGLQGPEADGASNPVLGPPVPCSSGSSYAHCPHRAPPFLLTLRLWDAYILEGGHLLTAMAYTVLKVHRRKWA